MTQLRHSPVAASIAAATVLLAAPLSMFGGPLAASAPASESSTTTTTQPPATTTTTTTTTTTIATTTTTAPPAATEPPVSVPCVPVTTTTTTTTNPLATTTTSTTTTTTTTTNPLPTTTTTTLPPPPPCPTLPTVPLPPPTEPAPAPETTEPAAAPLGIAMPKNISDILATIRQMESGGNYTIGPNRGNASGAYQYIGATWNNYKGFPAAYLAPPNIQDERALADVQAILWTWKGDVSMVPVIWYYPRAAHDPALMDQVPVPGAGNRLTVREYQRRWLDMLEFITGAPLGFRLQLVPPSLRFISGVPPELTPSIGPLTEVAFPALGRALVAPPAACDQTADTCAANNGSVAIVYGQKLQPVLAAVDGVVTAVEVGDPSSGAVTVTITDPAGRTFHYAGLNDDNPGTDDGAAPRALRVTTLAKVGTSVRAGQVIGFMGDTDPMPANEHRGIGGGDPVWPHLRLTIRDANGAVLDADLLVANAQRRQACHVGIGPWSVPADTTITDLERAYVDTIFHGDWTIRPDGTVIARGKSALILPPEDCKWAPPEAFGPDALGAEPTLAFAAPVVVPARYWVSGSVAGDTVDSPRHLMG